MNIYLSSLILLYNSNNFNSSTFLEDSNLRLI